MCVVLTMPCTLCVRMQELDIDIDDLLDAYIELGNALETPMQELPDRYHRSM